MRILVAYATNSSGTQTVSSIITDILIKNDHTVTHINIRKVTRDELPKYDLLIFGSPSWNYNKLEGMPHEFFVKFMSDHADLSLPEKKFAIFGLGDTAYMTFCGAVTHLEDFVKKIGSILATPSLKIDGFYFHEEENTEKVVQWTNSLIALFNKSQQEHNGI